MAGILSQFDERVTGDLARPFAVTGRRCYLIGHMDGSFPDMGDHLPGEMGGLWTPPLKLADGFWFGLAPAEGGEQTSPEWLSPAGCRSFTMMAGMAEREHTVAVGGAEVPVRQRMFVPEREPGVIITLTLTNASAHELSLTLSWLVRFDIQGAWWSGWPDRPDTALFDPSTGSIVAHDTLSTRWCAAMQADQPPARGETGVDLWAVERTGSLQGQSGKRKGLLRNPSDLQGMGISGRLDYSIKIAPGGSDTIRFAIAGGAHGKLFAQEAVSRLLLDYDGLLAEKRSALERLATGAPVVLSPRPDLDRTFALQTMCIDMLTLDIDSVGRGIVAGLPWFAWLFGCDTYYSVGGMLVSGQGSTALDNLRVLAGYARTQGGRVPHEITQTGDLFNPGNTVETGQYVRAVEQAYRWTGDETFLREVYDVCKEGIFSFMLGECDPKGDLLPDGPGMLELSTARHGKKLDVACSLNQGLRSLAYLAAVVGDEEVVAHSTQLADEVRDRINRYFWVPEREEYVWRIEPDLTAHPDEPAHSYAVLEMGVLEGDDHERIARLFDRIEGPEHTGPKGVIHPGTQDFVMPIQNAMVALAEFRYGRHDKGLWYLDRMAELCGSSMPWAIPEFEGPKGCFLQAWSSAAFNWLMVQGWFRLLPDPLRGVAWVRPQLPSGWDSVQVQNLTIWGNRYNLSLSRQDGHIDLDVEPLSENKNHPFQIDPETELPALFA